MKFVFAVVMLALAACVQSSLIAQHSPGVSYVTTALHPGILGAPLGLPLGLPLGHLGPLAGHGIYGGQAIPGISLAQGPAHTGLGLGLGHGVGLGHGLGLAHGAHGPGVYVAKTRGAIHTAPLAGHIASATSVNVAPAPGTH